MTEPIDGGWLREEMLARWATILDALDAVGIGVLVITDRAGAMERWYTSSAAAALLGLPPGDVSAVPVLDPVAPEERARIEEMRDRKRAGLPVPTAFETVIRRPDGTRVPVEVNVSHQVIPGGHLSITFIRDQSARQESQGALLEAERMAIVGAIAAGVAHEINNPLTYVLLHLRSLRRALPRWNLDAALAADADRLLAEAEGGADRVRVIVRDLLALARGQGSIDDSIDVVSVVDGAVRLLAPSMQHRARIVREGDRVPPVAGDETRIAHATLAMLLFAAAGFDRDDPSRNTVTVRIESGADGVTIEICDNGNTLTSEQCARAFEPFYAPRGGGASASLAVARTVATGLGGSVDLQCPDGGGTIIRMTLPTSTRRR